MNAVEELFDPERLEALFLSGLLDSPPEQAFDRFTGLAQQILGVPVVLISLVDTDRQFFKSQVGLPEPWATARETPLSHSFCQYVVNSRRPLVVDDARSHLLVKDNLAIAELGVMAYVGVPLQTSGQQVLGAFCAIDTQPHIWSQSEIEVLSALAEMVMREVELRRLAQNLQAKYQVLEGAEERRDDLVKMTIHDLRTPLNALLGGLQVLDMLLEEGDTTERKMLQIALRGGRSLSSMVNTILDVSRGEAGKMVLYRTPLSPPAIVSEAIGQVASLGEKKSLSISSEIAPGLLAIEADESKFCRVLVNLLGNAIQHTPIGGHIHIRVQNDETEEALLFRIEDNGSGLSPKDLQTIFDKFGQGSSKTPSQASTGLGLTFCKMVVESHGGKIWATSDTGRGSTFSFTIPPFNGETDTNIV